MTSFFDVDPAAYSGARDPILAMYLNLLEQTHDIKDIEQEHKYFQQSLSEDATQLERAARQILRMKNLTRRVVLTPILSSLSLSLSLHCTLSFLLIQ